MSADREIAAGKRFAFGANWAEFLGLLDDRRIGQAVSSLRDMLRVETLEGRSFLDIGCGSGLFSLAARRLGATVRSFDFDPQSVACANELRRRYYPGDLGWQVESGSVLDRAYMESLGTYDVVYSWGVLHHTGAMWRALENAIERVGSKRGKLFIAIYNDQGWKSRLWWLVKLTYNRLPDLLKRPFVTVMMVTARAAVVARRFLGFKWQSGTAAANKVEGVRGMGAKHDAIDWVGGFPYEVAEFDTLGDYLKARGFVLTNCKRNTSWGCSEWVAERSACAD
jgi:2-polyprenyl-3-methyl-5-hydroxy-6-metoxy-1,4-benzoquinol methylase